MNEFTENTRNESKSKFAEILKYLRENRGIGQRELAENIGVGKSIVSDWENCRHEPSMSNLVALADFFGISVDELVGRK